MPLNSLCRRVGTLPDELKRAKQNVLHSSLVGEREYVRSCVLSFANQTGDMPCATFAFSSVPRGGTYEELRENFFEQIRSLKPGLTEIIFHPQYATEFSKTITGSWQQRAWEVDLFSDPVVHAFFEDEGLIFTNWIEIMERFGQW